MNILGIILFIIGITSLYAAFILYFYNNAQRVHNFLKQAKLKLENSDDKNDLIDIYNELIDYARKECWHHHLSSHAREVLNYAKGKIDSIK